MTDNQNNNNEQVEDFKIGELLTEDNYLIPIYQRDYAWGQEQITQLIQDVWDYKDKQTYYIGTLVTHKRTEKEKHKGKYEVLDGQQRLTALYILVAALKSLEQSIDDKITNGLNLYFEAREKSSKTLKNILEGKIEGEMTSIIDGFNIAKDYLEEKVKKENLSTFTDYLLNNVTIVRTIVPEDTDLNHYFEIMNNRGEQLEKHEILKAKLLEKIDDEKQRTKYAKVWDACSRMDSYVQRNFDSEDREKLFGSDWNELDIDKIGCIQKTGDNEKENKYTIDKIIEDGISDTTTEEKEPSEGFKSIIDFPNFLLQVLKVAKNNNVSLDDKNLLSEENGFYKFKEDSNFTEDFAKKFIENLLKYRFWFDKYIIKKETEGDENWSLKKYTVSKNENNNQPYLVNTFNDNIRMIQSMFHVSNPSKSNKTWLNKVFEKCKEDINESKKPKSLLEILECISKELFTQKDNLDDLHYHGNRPTNYTFNLLDYVIWKNKNENEELKGLDFSGEFKKQFKKLNKTFSFKFRNSVEHFYPQNDDYSKGVTKEHLHQFGNLALTSKQRNSKFSNHPPKVKVNSIDNSYSLKFQLMAKQAENWSNDTIQAHQEDMIKLLENYFGSSLN